MFLWHIWRSWFKDNLPVRIRMVLEPNNLAVASCDHKWVSNSNVRAAAWVYHNDVVGVLVVSESAHLLKRTTPVYVAPLIEREGVLVTVSVDVFFSLFHLRICLMCCILCTIACPPLLDQALVCATFLPCTSCNAGTLGLLVRSLCTCVSAQRFS